MTFDILNLCYDFEMILRWLWDKPLLYDLLHDFETWLLVWYPSHLCFPTYGGTIGMSVMHHWHDSCVGEWFLTPSLLWLSAGYYDFEYMSLRLTLSKGRMDCNPRSDLFSGFNYDFELTLRWLVLCAIHAFHNFWELATPLLWYMRTPLILSGCLRGIPSDCEIMNWRLMTLRLWCWVMTLSFGLVVDDYPILFISITLIAYSLWYFPKALYFCSVSLSLLCLYICSLSFLSSAAFLFSCGRFSRKLGYGRRFCFWA